MGSGLASLDLMGFGRERDSVPWAPQPTHSKAHGRDAHATMMSNFDLEQLVVRNAMAEDLDALNALRPLGVLHADRIRGASADRYRYLVAEMADEIVGMVMLYFRPEMGWD